MKFNVWILAACLMLGAGTATAGWKTSTQVGIDMTYQMANGNLGTARNTADATQYLGCEVYAYSGGTVYAYCYARDINWNYKTCMASDPSMVNVAASLQSDGYLIFGWNSSGSCTFIEQQTQSYTPPKAP